MSQFKAKFPKIVLPPRFGGRTAIVVMSVGRATDPGVLFALCIDELGRVHPNVPLSMRELQAAARRPATFVEVPDQEAPLVVPP